MSLAPASDLRSALAGLEVIGETVEQVPMPTLGTSEIVTEYVMRYMTQTRSVYCDEQPLVQYKAVEGYGYDVLFGVFGSRRRNAWYLTGNPDAAASSCPKALSCAISNPISPELMSGGAPCQSEVVLAPNLYESLPVFRLTEEDTLPSVTLGLVYAWDEERGVGNCSFHRICLWKDGSVSLWIAPKRHLATLVSSAVKAGRRLAVTINIGLAPHVVIAACCTEPDVSNGMDELAIAGALQGLPIETVQCITSTGRSIANAEIVIEGTLGAETLSESDTRPQGYSIPEYLGYRRPSALATALRVEALTHRPSPIYQALTGPGREQSELLGIAQEVTVLGLLKGEYSDLVSSVFCCPSGGGNLNVFVQFKKKDQSDDQRVCDAGRRVAEAINCVKHVYLVDQDVNLFSPADVLWAFTTRYRSDLDLIVIDSCRGTVFDPTQSCEYSASVSGGRVSKCVFDCTVPFKQRKRFARAFYPSERGCDA